MPQKRDLDPTASPAHFFGAEVRREREARKMSQPALGKFIPCDGSQISRVEGGEWPSDMKFGPPREIWRPLLAEYGYATSASC